MICPFCREKDTSVVDSDPLKMEPQLEEEEFALVVEVKDLLLLNVFNFVN